MFEDSFLEMEGNIGSEFWWLGAFVVRGSKGVVDMKLYRPTVPTPTVGCRHELYDQLCQLSLYQSRFCQLYQVFIVGIGQFV